MSVSIEQAVSSLRPTPFAFENCHRLGKHDHDATSDRNNKRKSIIINKAGKVFQAEDDSTFARNDPGIIIEFRNATLNKLGLKAPLAVKTGTTIVGCSFKDGVILAADSRATAGDVIADKMCVKLTAIADLIYVAGAGTAADLHEVGRMLTSNMKLMEMNTGRKPRVVAAVRIARQHLYRYQGHVGAYLIVGGVDFYGPQLLTLGAGGSSLPLPFVADGSGSYAALGILQKGYVDDMEEEAALNLIKAAVSAGMAGDLASGNSYCYTVIKKDGVKSEKFIKPDFCKSSDRDLKYRYPANTTTVVKSKEIKYEIVEEMEVA